MLYLKEKPRADLQGVDIGSIVHDVIEKICVGMEADGVSFETADKEYFRKKIRIMLDKYIQRLGCEYAQLSKRQLYSIKRLEYVILLCFETIQKQFTDSKFVPMGYEIVFDDENIGCIEIKLDDGRVLKLTGKIDRADVYCTEGKNYLRVVDYKSGSPNTEAGSIESLFNGETRNTNRYVLQTMLYSMILHHTENREVKPALYFARNMSNENFSPYIKIKDSQYDEVTYTEHATAFEEQLSAKLRELFNPDIPFIRCSADDDKSCEYCDFKTICKR